MGGPSFIVWGPNFCEGALGGSGGRRLSGSSGVERGIRRPSRGEPLI